MRAFGIFTAVAAAALALVPSAFAAPLVAADAVAVAGADAVVGRDVAVRGVGSCVDVLADLKVDVQVHVDALGEFSQKVWFSELTRRQLS